MHKTGRDGDGRGRFEGGREAKHDAAVQIDREGHRWPADDGPVGLAHQPDVARRAVGLDPLPGCSGTGMRAGQQAQRACGFRALAPAHQPGLVAVAHAGRDSAIRRRSCSRDLAAFGYLPVQSRDARAVGLGVMLVDRLRDDRLNAGTEPLRPWRALSRQEGCDIAVARRRLPQQRPYTPALDPEFLCDGVHIGPAAGGPAGQRREKIAPARGLGPLRVAETSLVRPPALPGARRLRQRESQFAQEPPTRFRRRRCGAARHPARAAGERASVGRHARPRRQGRGVAPCHGLPVLRRKGIPTRMRNEAKIGRG